MTTSHFLFYTFTVAVFCSCALLKPDEPSPYHGLSDQAQIYSLVFDLRFGPDSNRRIDNELKRLPESTDLLVRVSETTGGDKGSLTKRGQKLTAFSTTERNLDKTTIVEADYVTLITACGSLSDSATPFDLRLLRSRYRYAINFWNRSYDTTRVFLGPSISFSRIAFNSDSTKAVVYTTFHCDMCASGDFWLLEKRRGDWRLHSILGMWVS